MVRADTCLLIAEDPQAHGIFDDPEETTREVYCTVRSVGQNETDQGKARGLNLELKLILAHAFEYQDEKRLIFRGVRYIVDRTYVSGDKIELTVYRETGNAAPAEVSGNV